MENAKILRIEFDHHREIVTIIYSVDGIYYGQFFSFLVWNENDCFSAKDLTDLIIKYSQNTEP